MNLNEIARVLYRRWWVVAPVLVLTLLAAFLIVTKANSVFEANATLLLASPELGGSQQQTSGSRSMLNPSIIAEIVGGDTTRVELGSEPGATDYSVTLTGENILQVEATNDTAIGVVKTADAVIDKIQRVIEDMKADAPERDASFDVLSRPRLARERTVVGESGETTVEFFASGSVLVNIADPVETRPFNPYTPSEGTLRVLAEVVAPERIRESIVEGVDDDEAGFELIFDIRDVAPILHVVATATSPEAAMDTLASAVGFLESDLEARQTLAGAEKSTFIWYQRVVYPQQAEVASGGLSRPLATIVVLGVVAAISLAVLFDTVIAHREKVGQAADGDGSHEKGQRIEAEGPQRELGRRERNASQELSDALARRKAESKESAASREVS